MDPTVKAEWVRRLRSGEYKQTFGALEKTAAYTERPGMCCLGVLSAMAAEAGVCERTVTRSGLGMYGDQDIMAPLDVIDWAGLPVAHGGDVHLDIPFSLDGTPTYLSGCNDRGIPFSQIADLIDHFL